MQTDNFIIISVIIPVYNGAAYLAETIRNILAQSFAGFELILVDDGSTDESAAICDAFAGSDRRVHVLHQANGGMSSARDAGYRMISEQSEWILFMDADDLLRESCFRTILDLSGKDGGNPDCILSWLVQADDREIRNYAWPPEAGRLQVLSGAAAVEEVFGSSPDRAGITYTTLCGTFVRRGFFDRIAPRLRELQNEFPQNYMNDVIALPMLVQEAESCAVNPSPEMLYRMSSGSDSHRRGSISELQMELAEVTRRNFLQYERMGCVSAYQHGLIGYYLTILKVMYQCRHFGAGSPRSQEVYRKCSQDFRTYYGRLKGLSPDCRYDRIGLATIRLHHFSPWLWEHTIGRLRYGT